MVVISRKIVAPVQRFLDELYERYIALDEGAIADYIPEL
jgi:hypothetical protein